MMHSYVYHILQLCNFNPLTTQYICFNLITRWPKRCHNWSRYIEKHSFFFIAFFMNGAMYYIVRVCKNWCLWLKAILNMWECLAIGYDVYKAGVRTIEPKITIMPPFVLHSAVLKTLTKSNFLCFWFWYQIVICI